MESVQATVSRSIEQIATVRNEVYAHTGIVLYAMCQAC